MDLTSDVVFFLGAGASLSKPAGGPLFSMIRDTCVKSAGSDPSHLYGSMQRNRNTEKPPGLLLLDHVIPEVFLKEFADAGYQLHDPLAKAVRGFPGTGPNPVHRLTAHLIGKGGEVWTTNWDTWIEEAWKEKAGANLKVAVAPEDDPTTSGVGLFKVHGTASEPLTLQFATPDIMRPLPPEWHDRLVNAAAGHVLVIVGYGGADVDLFPALRTAIHEARAAYWFEGTNVHAEYERWRFELSGIADPSDLPDMGAHLVWCGSGSTVRNPSEGLLVAFGYGGVATDLPDWQQQFEAVDAAISQVRQTVKQRGKRLQLSALISERMGRRWTAALRHAGVVFLGPAQQRSRSIRSIGNMVLLRAQPLRKQATKLATWLIRDQGQADFLRSQVGGINHDPERAARVADGREMVGVDAALTIALATRWAGDLTIAESIARTQFDRALTENLSSAVRDWPERVSRACFEIAQALIWQGRIYEAEDQARSAYMRVSGAKWTAWEYTFRAIASFAQGDPERASNYLDTSLKLLQAEGFRDFTPQVWCHRAACARARGDLGDARRLLAKAERTPRKGPGTRAVILAEQAEIAHAAGQDVKASGAWAALTESALPLWSALGFLRLAEQGHACEENASKALERFEAIQCRWGTLRTSTLLGLTSDRELEAMALPLGPVAVFRRNGPWLF